MTVVGLLNPGAMGASVGAAALTNVDEVLWASEGRSDATRMRAEKAGLTRVNSFAALVNESELILSVCPPASALSLASQVFSLDFKGTYVDCNAIAPKQTRAIAEIANDKGARIVDGGIIGGPAWQATAGTRLWLSGPDVSQVIALFEHSPLLTGVAGCDIGAASALKMCFAAFTKGSTALLAAVLAVADKEGVGDVLAEQWGEAFTNNTKQQVTTNSAKAWRFAGEMEQIAATFDSAGLPGGFHDAAAEVFNRLSDFKDWQSEPAFEDLLQALQLK